MNKLSQTCKGLNCHKKAVARGHCHGHLYRFYTYGDFEKTKYLPWYVAKELFDKLSIIETDECVLWTGKIHNGYGRLYLDGKIVRTHRLALEMHVPKPPGNKMALHKPIICHDPLCMNYRHLYWGTAKENARDVRIDGTVMVGTRNHRAVLKEGDADRIRKEYASGDITQKAIALKYKIASSQVNKIIKGKAWI